MADKKHSFPVRCIAVMLTVVFLHFAVCFDSYGQVDTATGSAVVIAEEIKQPLPEPGNVTVNFKDVDIKTILHYLSEVSGVDIIPAPGVDAKVTMRLRDKPWEVALDIVTRNYGYVYSREGEIIRVIPKGKLQAEEPITEVISLNHIIRDIELVEEETTETVSIREKQETIQQIMSAINSILDKKRGEKATYISGANAIVVTAVPARISSIKEMIKRLDRKTPQILLDAKVIEISLNDDERFGIDWNTVITAAGARRPITFPFNNIGVLPWLPGSQRDYYARAGSVGGAISDPNISTTIPTIDVQTLADPLAAAADNAIFSFGTLDFSTFQATLSLLDQRGDTEIISCPRVTTLNNQKATIKVIEKIMLQKTQETTQTAGIVTVEFEKESEAREVGVKLTIIPHVNKDGEITVNLMPEVSTRVGENDGFDVIPVGGFLNTVALTFSSREANTRVRVVDGDTIFIGGLIRDNVAMTDNKFPILGDLFGGIPVLGNAFRYERENVTKSEIVFFVTVHIVKEGKDTIVKSQSTAAYDKYVPRFGGTGSGKAQAEKSGLVSIVEVEGEEEERPETNTVNAGTMAVSETTVPIAVMNTDEKKEYKPFLDFRKKKQ